MNRIWCGEKKTTVMKKSRKRLQVIQIKTHLWWRGKGLPSKERSCQRELEVVSHGPATFPFSPETNTQFKCLYLGYSSSIIHSLLFSLPELKLKKLRMRTQTQPLMWSILFFLLRPVPVWLTWRSLPFQTRRAWTPSRWVCFWSCPCIDPLSVQPLPTREQETGLDELMLDSIKFDDIDIREFFTTMRHFLTSMAPLCVDAARIHAVILLGSASIQLHWPMISTLSTSRGSGSVLS